MAFITHYALFCARLKCINCCVNESVLVESGVNNTKSHSNFMNKLMCLCTAFVFMYEDCLAHCPSL